MRTWTELGPVIDTPVRNGSDEAARRGRATRPDVSPHGVTPRPNDDLRALLDELDSGDVEAVGARLDAGADPVVALIWGGALAHMGTPTAESRLDAYAKRLERDDP